MAHSVNVDPQAFIAEGARVYGEVRIGRGSSVWFNAVLRGDEGPIAIGENTNVQDCCVLHSDMGVGIEIGDWVTIGHGSVVRGATIGSDTMIGMNCTVMTGAVIPEGCIVGAHSFVPYNAHYPPRSMIYGTPARVMKGLGEEELQGSRVAGTIYKELAERYRSGSVPHL